MIKLICFDLWQTLVYRDVNYQTVPTMAKLAKSKLSKKELVKRFESSIQTKKWKSEYKMFENLAKNIGIGIDEEKVKLLMDLRDHADSKTKLYSYVLPTLRKLKRKGYEIGILSNSSVFDVKYMQEATHLLKFVDYPLFSFEVGKIKPDLGFFKKMLKVSKYKPEEVIMIGDKKEDDVIPAKKVGMNAIHFKNYNQLKIDLKRFGVEI